MTKNERFILYDKTTDSNVWDTLKKQCYSWEYVVSLLNELHDECEFRKNESLKENKELKQFKQKVFDLINRKINESEEDYNRAVKAGMPSMSIYEEIELLEYLKKELEE